MINLERDTIANALVAIVFSLRPNDGPEGQAWVLSIATTVMARAILGGIGPTGDSGPVLALARAQVEKAVLDTQSKFFRDKLSIQRPPAKD
mgnify:CR=1 FL=1